MDSESDKSKLSNSTCRCCLGNFDLTNSLFDFVEFNEGDSSKVEMRAMLLKLTKVVVIKTNETVEPVRLCQDCTEKLINAYEFVCSVEKNEEVINDYFSRVSEEKEEVDELSQDYEAVDEQLVEVFNYDEPQDIEYLEEDYPMMEGFPEIEERFTEENLLMIENAENAENDDEIWETHLQTLPEDEEPIQVKASVPPQKEHKVTSRKPRTNGTAKRRMGKQYSIGSRLGIYETSNWHKCSDCDRSFAKLSTLERHVKVAHTPVSAEDFAAIAPKPSSEQPVQCDHCLRTFVRRDAMLRHVQAMHPEHVDTERKTPNESASKNKSYVRRMCPYCGEYFSQAGLIVHIRRHTGETPYQCEQCGKGFPRRQDMVVHMRQHSGEKPHPCTVCGKSFKNPNKLARHTRIHTGVRPYKCSECGKGFAQSNDLKIHMRRHTGEKPYKCDVCGEGFICGAALKTHRKNKLHHEPVQQKVVDPYEKVRVRNRVKLNVIGEFSTDEAEEIITDDYVGTIKTEGDSLVDVISLIVHKE